MNGFILTMKSSSSDDIVKANYKLFGRISSSRYKGRNRKYFYAGALDQINYTRLANGCYFIEKEIPPDRLYSQMKAAIDVPENKLRNARSHWRRIARSKNLEVENL